MFVKLFADVGGLLLTMALIFQFCQMYKRRNHGLKDISFLWLSVGTAGNCLMLTWAILENYLTVITLNTVGLIMTTTSIVLYIISKRRVSK